MRTDRWLPALALSSVASGVAGLLVPLYLVRIGATAPQLGVSAALSSLVGAPGAVLAGRYADRTGKRRRVVLAALAVAAVATAALPALSSVWPVVVVNAVLWLALSAITPVLTMLAVQGVPESEWNGRVARLNTYQGYGATVGLVLGTVWTAAGATVLPPALAQRSLFALAAVVSVVAAALAARSLPAESTGHVGPRRSERIAAALSRTNRRVRDATFSFGGNRVFWATQSLSWRRLRRLRSSAPTALWAYFAAAFVFFVGFAVFWAPLPLYLTRAGFASGPVFGLYLVNNVASAALYGGAGRASTRFDVRLVQGGALGVRGLAFVAVAGLGLVGLGVGGGPAALATVGAVLTVVGVTWAFIAITGTAIVSRFAPERARGAVLGTYAALSAVAGSVGSLSGGWLATRSFTVAFGVAAGLVVAGGVLVVAVGRPDKHRPTARAGEDLPAE